MPNRSRYGNLTAALVVVALLELVVGRVLARLFLSPGCQSGVGCLWLRAGPFLLHLTGVLGLIVGAGGIVGHLRRGEMFPRGMRFTVAALSLVFMLLVVLSLLFGQMPERLHVHETSFGFVVALLLLSFVGSQAASARTRAGFVLFVLPVLFNVAAMVVGARPNWLRSGSLSPDSLRAVGEVILLLAASTAPVLLSPAGAPRSRMTVALALAAGSTAFFFRAFLVRPDLVQTVALYSVHLELPPALSLLGAAYVLALFGFLTALGLLLLSPGPSRLAGLGLCLIGIAGYQTSSSVELLVGLCGFLALATGTLRTAGGGVGNSRLSPAAWRAMLDAIASGIAGSPVPDAEPVLIEVIPGSDPEVGGESDTTCIRAPRRGRPIAIELRRVWGVVRSLQVTIGTPRVGPPDATIESHEAWLGRRPEDRSSLPRIKTGDQVFDRKLGVHGRAPLADRSLRRRVLRLADGTITLWRGTAVRFVAPANPTENLRRLIGLSGPVAARSLGELVDTLIDLTEAGDDAAAPDAA